MTAQLIQKFAPSIPAGTALASPVTIAMNMPSRIVKKIRIRVPPGPGGQMGFQIASNGQQIIPENTGAFIVADNEVFEWDIIDFPEGDAYQLIGYNTGLYQHTVYITFELDPVTVPVVPTPGVLAAATLAQAGQSTIAAPSVPTASSVPAQPTTAPVAAPVVPPAPPVTIPPVTVPGNVLPIETPPTF